MFARVRSALRRPSLATANRVATTLPGEMAAGPQLSPRLEQVLQAIPDRAFAERLRKVYVAAAQAVVQLADMDLVKYESTGTERAPDLSLWEEMAPVIRDTVMDVNAMVSVLREQ